MDKSCATLGRLNDGHAETLRAAGLEYYNHNRDRALHSSLQILRNWKQGHAQGLQALGWTVQPGDTPLFCTQPPAGVVACALCASMREQGLVLETTV